MENQNTDNQTRPQIVVAQTTKSTGISILLILLFGPLGLFYSTIIGGLTMTFLFGPAVFVILLFGHFFTATAIILLLLTYPICIIWGMRAVNTYNQKLLRGEQPTENFHFSIFDIVQFLLIGAFVFCYIYAVVDIFKLL